MRRGALARRHRRRAVRAPRGGRSSRRRARTRRCPGERRDWWSMPPPRPSSLIAELSYQCPLHCPYCSNPLDIGGDHYRIELATEDWVRVFEEARALGVLQLALTGGEPMLRRDLVELCAGARDAGLYSSLITAGTLFTRERGASAEVRRARPRADLDPEPERRRQRSDRREPVVREEARGRALPRRSSTSRSRSTASCTGTTSIASTSCSSSPWSSGRSGSSSRTRSTTAGRSRTRTR